MEAAVVSTVGLVLKLVAQPATKKFKSMWKNDDHIKKLADTIDYLGDVLSDVHGKKFKKTSVNNGFKRLREVFLDAEDFLDRVRTIKKKQDAKTRKRKQAEEEILGKTKDTVKRSLALAPIKIKRFKTKVGRFLSSSNQTIYAFKVNSGIKKIRKNLDAISQDLLNFGPREPSSFSDAAHTTLRESGPFFDATEIIGRDEDKRKIVNLMLRSFVDQKKIPVTSIVGIGGMGKTTAAQLVYHDESLQKSCTFDMKMWVSDSKKFDLKSLLKHLLKSICPDDTSLDSLEEDHLRKRLVKEIGGKRFILVLDDVENEDRWTWENLEKLLNFGSKESRILITTRSRKVGEVVSSSGSVYELQGLSEKDSLQLFERYAFRGREVDSLAEIAKLIVVKCCGVPLAIKVIGSLLCGEQRHKWEYVRDNSFADIAEEGNQLMPVLKISYDHLDSTLKQCFQFCALFPKNHHISKETLGNIWMDNVRFKTNKGKTLEDVCDKALSVLYSRCFLEAIPRNEDLGYGVTHFEMQKEYLKMHDLMHDLAKEVAGSHILVVDWDDLILEDVRHVFLKWGGSTFQPKGRRIRTFLPEYLLCERKIKDDFIVSNCPVLRFLDLSWQRIGNLSDSIGKLIHLRCLLLYGNSFKSLPNSICELINLRHLDLARCGNLTQLPSGIGALTSLQVLNLYHCEKLEELPCSFKNLVNLVHLTLSECRSLTKLPSGMGELTSLQVLEIFWVNLEELPRGMGALMRVCTPARFIVGYPEFEHNAQLEELGPVCDLPAELTIELPYMLQARGDGEALLLNKKSLRKLEISFHVPVDNEGEEEEEEVSDEKMKIIEKISNEQMEILWKLRPPSNLEEFKLLGYQGSMFLSSMFKDDFATIVPNLVSLDITYCTCPYLAPLSRLPCLKTLRVFLLEYLEYIEVDNVSDAPFCLPKLEDLQLIELPELKGWCKGHDTGVDEDDNNDRHAQPLFPLLSTLKVFRCHDLREGTLLSFLKPFSIEKDIPLSQDISLSPSFHWLPQLCMKSLFKLSLEEKDSLRLEISCFEATETRSRYKADTLRRVFHHVTHLEFFSCPGLKTLPGLLHLPALRELKIAFCDEFTGEEEEENESSSNPLQTSHHPDMAWLGLSSLQRLTLSYLPKMERLPEGIPFLTSLQQFEINMCDNLQVPEWLPQTTFDLRPDHWTIRRRMTPERPQQLFYTYSKQLSRFTAYNHTL